MKIHFWLILLAAILFPLSANALIGMTREELIKNYGAPFKVENSVYGAEFTDLSFTGRSKSDYKTIVFVATVWKNVCYAIWYIKMDDNGQPADFAPDEIRNWMLGYSQPANATWKQKSEKEWQLDKGPGVPFTYQVNWSKKNLLKIVTDELLDEVLRSLKEKK